MNTNLKNLLCWTCVCHDDGHIVLFIEFTSIIIRIRQCEIKAKSKLKNSIFILDEDGTEYNLMRRKYVDNAILCCECNGFAVMCDCDTKFNTIAQPYDTILRLL